MLMIPDGEIYGLGAEREHCILADSTEWECALINYTITGRSKLYPILSFAFNVKSKKNYDPVFTEKVAVDCAKDCLYDRSKKGGSVFSSISYKRTGQTSYGKTYFVFEGSYFNNNSSGSFCFYIQPITSNVFYSMFVELREDFIVLDEQLKNEFCQYAFDLITPLCFP